MGHAGDSKRQRSIRAVVEMMLHPLLKSCSSPEEGREGRGFTFVLLPKTLPAGHSLPAETLEDLERSPWFSLYPEIINDWRLGAIQHEHLPWDDEKLVKSLSGYGAPWSRAALWVREGEPPFSEEVRRVILSLLNRNSEDAFREAIAALTMELSRPWCILWYEEDELGPNLIMYRADVWDYTNSTGRREDRATDGSSQSELLQVESD